THESLKSLTNRHLPPLRYLDASTNGEMPAMFDIRLLRAGLLVLLLTGLTSVPVRADEPRTVKKLLAIEDLFRMDSPGPLILSRNGQRAVFVRHWFDPETKRERHSLWLVDTQSKAARSLELDEPDARAPVFSPDGEWIAFLSTRPQKEDFG